MVSDTETSRYKRSNLCRDDVLSRAGAIRWHGEGFAKVFGNPKPPELFAPGNRKQSRWSLTGDETAYFLPFGTPAWDIGSCRKQGCVTCISNDSLDRPGHGELLGIGHTKYNLQRIFISTDFGDAQAHKDPNGATLPKTTFAFDSTREAAGESLANWVTRLRNAGNHARGFSKRARGPLGVQNHNFHRHNRYTENEGIDNFRNHTWVHDSKVQLCIRCNRNTSPDLAAMSLP